MSALRRRAPKLVAALFGTSGAVHLLRPRTFEPLIPRWLPNARAVVYVSGMAELICAIGLIRRTRWSRAASVLLLIGVFPGNVQMAVDAASTRNGQLTLANVLAYARLPLQLPLIWAAWQVDDLERPTVRDASTSTEVTGAGASA